MSENNFTENESTYEYEEEEKSKSPLIRTSTIIAFCVGALIGVLAMVIVMKIIDGTDIPLSDTVSSRSGIHFEPGNFPDPNQPLQGFYAEGSGATKFQSGTFDTTIDGEEEPPVEAPENIPGTEPTVTNPS